MNTERLNSTGYADGDIFSDAEMVRGYFTTETMREMFGSEADFSEAELAEMADYVIDRGLHCDFLPTDDAIAALRVEAAAAGDDRQVSLCNRALDGQSAALRECARVIADAAAQED